MAVQWDQDARYKILETIIELSQDNNRPIEEAFELFSDFINRPRRHSSFMEKWIEFVEEISEEDFEAQDSESTESVTTQIEQDSKVYTMEDFRKAKVHMDDEEPSQTKETDATNFERFKETLKELEDECISISEEVSAILRRKPQPKRDDAKSLPIPCSIGEVNFEGALCDSNINLMTLSLVMTDTMEEAHNEKEDKEEDQDKLLI
ncbi:hypothetical protein L195_g007076 [Trifolium pratense]|uniref:Uncharacterized protein n=1 Tax=Trifolium pratense TaxID=57577 RepID=A0A2K3P5C8_TRIPR|nr:hypothetical protein L195_g007076 [Trifolium pratense]